MASNGNYPRFRKIDGTHPFKKALPEGHVDYRARRRNGKVVYFNFDLGREMGLIDRRHPDRLNRQLTRAILDTFALEIINEYDQQRGVSYSRREMMPGSYMATRYLQMQHPGRQGLTSGDGRSVWNGRISNAGRTWDVSSCGTGVTRLCPATAEQNRFLKTGNRVSSYGCGTASLEEGVSGALMIETLHRNGIATERGLAVILLDNGFAINVRASPNLLRPSHFLLSLKQNDRRSLQAVVDCYVDRQEANGLFPELRGSRRYRFLAQETARVFGRMAATFEREYIFCWLDWDGDNILCDGGIIDYGSVRQFGLFHREYRFDDGPRMSTTITEQRQKARYIVQCFAQIRDFLVKGKKTPLIAFSKDPVLEIFDGEFSRTRDELLLRNVGFEPATVRSLLRHHRKAVRRFDRAHAYFERARSARGPVAADDGLTWNAIFSVRDLLRELPRSILRTGEPMDSGRFIETGLSSYATRADRRMTPHRRKMAGEFQRAYLGLIDAGARAAGCSAPLLLSSIAWRSGIINRYARITGDAALYAARKLMRTRKRLTSETFHQVFRRFVDDQCLVPDLTRPEVRPPAPRTDAKRLLDGLVDLIAECRHGL
jgi:hypothetical protein